MSTTRILESLVQFLTVAMVQDPQVAEAAAVSMALLGFRWFKMRSS